MAGMEHAKHTDLTKKKWFFFKKNLFTFSNMWSDERDADGKLLMNVMMIFFFWVVCAYLLLFQ